MEEIDFDNAPAHSAEGEATEQVSPPKEDIPGHHEEIVFADPPKHDPPKQDELQPDTEEITKLITNAVHPLEIAISKMNESLQDAIQQAIQRPQSETSPDAYNISALQFQAAMLQPCNAQILPAAVRDEIDRLYRIEDAHNIAKRAEHALNHIIDHALILLKIPDDPDEQRLMLSMLNTWYTKAYPDRKPLKIASTASSPS